MTAHDWVKVGQTVVMRHAGFGTSYAGTGRIAKVYKNGNFTLEGRDGQWRPWNNFAHRTGDASRFNWESCVPLTDEIKAEVAQERALSRAKNIVRNEMDRLSALWRGHSHEAIIEEANSISARQKP